MLIAFAEWMNFKSSKKAETKSPPFYYQLPPANNYFDSKQFVASSIYTSLYFDFTEILIQDVSDSEVYSQWIWF